MVDHTNLGVDHKNLNKLISNYLFPCGSVSNLTMLKDLCGGTVLTCKYHVGG